MPEGTEKDAQSPAEDEKKTTPPWGDDFDAEKAWTLIVNLREDVTGLKKDRDSARSEATEWKAAAEKTGEDREKALGEALKRAEKAERDLAIRKHNLPDDVVEEFADFLSGTPDEVDAKAARLAARLTPKADEADGDAEQDSAADKGDEIPGKPKAALRPGHGGEQDAPFDPDAIAAAARASF